jgi:hypothetical protein
VLCFSLYCLPCGASSTGLFYCDCLPLGILYRSLTIVVIYISVVWSDLSISMNFNLFLSTLYVFIKRGIWCHPNVHEIYILKSFHANVDLDAHNKKIIHRQCMCHTYRIAYKIHSKTVCIRTPMIGACYWQYIRRCSVVIQCSSTSQVYPVY